MVLLLSLDEERAKQHATILNETPKGGELFERIRQRVLQQLS